MGSTDFLPSVLAGLAVRIERYTGLCYKEQKYGELASRLQRSLSENRPGSVAQLTAWLLSEPWTTDKTNWCAQHLTVPETYFFRERRAFELLCQYAAEENGIPGKERTALRIWSAGCCTGEEPYSIAMMLKERVPHLQRAAVTILATDINPAYLDRARAGLYRAWSLRGMEPALERKYFSRQDDGWYRISDDIRSMVRFEALNLADHDYSAIGAEHGGFDFIFCRNVLMYMSRPRAAQVIARFRRCLTEGGWLVVSPSEASSDLFSGFAARCYPDAIFFRKQSIDSNEVAQHGETAVIAQPNTLRPAAKRVVKQVDAGRVSRGSSAAVHQAHAGPTPAQLIRPQQGHACETARQLASQGKLGQAIVFLRQAIAAQPAEAELYHALALLEMDAGESENAIRSLKKLIYLQPDAVLAHYLLGVLHIGASRSDDARRYFQTAGRLLVSLPDDALVPGSDGWSTAYLLASISSYMQQEELWQ